VNVNVLTAEDGRLNPVGGSTRLDEAHRSLDRFLHHLAELTGRLDLSLAGDRDGFDGQQLAADLGPRQSGHHTDQILELGFAVTEPRHAEELLDVLDRDLDRLLLRQDQVLDTLACERRQFPLQVAHTGLPRITADGHLQCVVVDGELLCRQRVLLQDLRDQVTARDLDLLVLRVAGDPDDLHTVHEGRRDVQRIRRRHEHHVRQVIVDLEVMIVERRVLLRIEHFQESR